MTAWRQWRSLLAQSRTWDLAVIGPGEDVGDPERDEPTEREAAMVGVGLEVRVEEMGEAESDEEAKDQRDVVDAFVGEAEGGGHGGAPTRGGEERRCTAAGPRGKDPGQIRVNMHRLQRLDKEIMRDNLYACSAKGG